MLIIRFLPPVPRPIMLRSLPPSSPSLGLALACALLATASPQRLAAQSGPSAPSADAEPSHAPLQPTERDENHEITTVRTRRFWVANFGTAMTLPKGKIGFAAGLGGQVVRLGNPRETRAFLTIPHAGFRYGLGHRTDV